MQITGSISENLTDSDLESCVIDSYEIAKKTKLKALL